MPRPNVLFICADRVGPSMAGVGIRAYELARVVSAHAEVTLAALEGSSPLPGVELITYSPGDPHALRAAIEAADAIVAQPQWPHVSHWLGTSGAKLIFDVYDPEPFESMEWLSGRPLVRAGIQILTLDRLAESFRIGHHFMCAGEKQRDLWIGMLLSQRLITPREYDQDPSLLDRLDLVPFGVPTEPAVHSGAPGPRELFGFGAEVELMLWNGGIWKWLDAPTAIRATAELVKRRPQARLVFMGTATHGPGLVAQEEARALAAELGLLDSHVFFNAGWVPYAERANWLLEADCSVSTHVEHLETRFAFRTRLLDCFWSGLPIVCTSGDELADRVEAEGLGATAPQRDPVALAASMERVLSAGRESHAEALAHVAGAYAWTEVAAPLLAWLSDQGIGAPLGGRFGGRLARGPAQTARHYGVRAGIATRNRLGLENWPRL